MRAKTTRRKVLIYCVDSRGLLVFRHLDHGPEHVGIQVPGGSIKDGESIERAALRELAEETGFDGFALDGIIGTDSYDISPYRWEVQKRCFVRAHPTASLPDRWQGQEDHDGRQPPTRFEFFWIPLESAHVLQSGQASMIWKLLED